MGLNHGIAYTYFRKAYLFSISSLWCVISSLASASRTDILQAMILLTTHMLRFQSHTPKTNEETIAENYFSVCDIEKEEHLAISILSQDISTSVFDANAIDTTATSPRGSGREIHGENEVSDESDDDAEDNLDCNFSSPRIADDGNITTRSYYFEY